VRLVGIDALSFNDRLVLEATRSIREDFLHQNAFHEVDTYASLKKQLMMLSVILAYYEQGMDALNADASFAKLTALPVREAIARFKYTPEEECEERFKQIMEQLCNEMNGLSEGGEEDA